MKVASMTAVAVAVSLAAACTRTTSNPQSTQPKASDRACRAVVAAPAGDDRDIARLQQDLRERRQAQRAAEHLGYRFVARARLSNNSLDYAVAEQAAACLESITPHEPAAWLLRGHVLHQLHRFSEAEAIARRLVTTREFVLDFGLLGDVLLEQGGSPKPLRRIKR